MAHCRRTGVWLFVLILPLGQLTAPTRAQRSDEGLSRVVLSGEAPRTARRLADAQKLVEQQQWAEAISEYQHILSEAGDDLVPLGPRHSVEARRLVHQRLAALPPAALGLYRSRVDEQAKKWLDTASPRSDLRLLQRIVAEAFCSRPAERALNLLGDLAFERGQFEDAERCWRHLVRLPSAVQAEASRPGNPELFYPDPQGDVALLRAKVLLARVLRGERAGLAEELAAFRKLHGTATGQLAGLAGNYADTLQMLAAQPEPPHVGPRETDWLTFGGAPSRNFMPTEGPHYLRYDGPPLRIPLDGAPRLAEELDPARPLTASIVAQRLRYYPVIVGDQAVIADTHTISVYDLLTGRRVGVCNLQDDLKLKILEADNIRLPRDVRFTLTVADGFIYARLGTLAMAEPRGGDTEVRNGRADSYLVCLSLQPDRTGKLVPRWPPIPARLLDRGPALIYEGAPVVRDGRVYIARSRFAGALVTTSIDCHDASDGSPRWQQEICETSPLGENELRNRQHLLTLAGPNMVYCSHSGAVVALDADTGKRSWAVRYPSRGMRTVEADPSPRELAPCVYDAGRLFVAPADLDRILCLDALTGQTLWESKAIEVVHLLGVARGRLIFTTGSFPRGIRAHDAATGADERSWLQPDDGNELPALGRGFFAGGQVFWPTWNGLRILNQEDGQPVEIDPTRLRHIQGGNMAFANGHLVVAGPEELYVYTAPGRLLEQRKQEAAREPKNAVRLHRLGVAEADAGQADAALVHLAQAERLAGAEERWQEELVQKAAQRRRYDLLMERADQARKGKQWDEAARWFQLASSKEFEPTERANALAYLAFMMRYSADRPERAVAVAQSILTDESLRGTHIQLHLSIPSPAFATALIRTSISANETTIYEKFEQKAAELSAAAKGDAREQSLETLIRHYPNARVTRSALPELGNLYEEQRLYGAAAECYRFLLRLNQATGENDPHPWMRLALVYEKENCRDAARNAWKQVLQRTAVASASQVRSLAQKHLSRLQNDESDSQHSIHWRLHWHIHPAKDLDEDLGCIADVEGNTSDRLLFVQGSRLICRDSTSGKTNWQKSLSQPPIWIGCHADILVLATERELKALRLDDGRQLWEGPRGRFGSFRFVREESSCSIVCVKEANRLVKIDAETGEMTWCRFAPNAFIRPVNYGGQYCPNYSVVADQTCTEVNVANDQARLHLTYWNVNPRLVVQSTSGSLQILDLTGCNRPAFITSVNSKPWPSPPISVGNNNVCLVEREPRLILIDVGLPTAFRTYRPDRARHPSLSNEPLQAIGNQNALLVRVATNLRYGLECLDSKTGESRWPQPLRFRRDQPFNLANSSLDKDAVYLVHGHTLHAHALTDGKRLWSTPLPGPATDWRVQLVGGHVMAYPREAPPSMEFAQIYRRFLLMAARHFWRTLVPMPPAAEWRRYATHLEQAHTQRRLDVLFCSPKDGKVAQHLTFPAAGPEVAVSVGNQRLTVATSGRAWGFRGN